MENARIRQAASANKVKLWQVAEAMGVAESTFHRYMRHELPEKKQEEIIAMIRKVAVEREQGAE